MPKTILLFADWYEPGFKAGGPIRSCVNFVHQMKGAYRIFVFTRDRDLNETKPYPSVMPDSWIDLQDNVKLYYSSPEKLTWKNIRKQLYDIRPDFVYLNSMYSRFFTIYPLLMKALGGIGGKLILSPRGMLKQSALEFKSKKKNLFLVAFKALGLHRKVHFHATDEIEQQDIARLFGVNSQRTMISNFPAGVEPFSGTPLKKPGELKIVFVGRLHPIKNLDYLLELLPETKGRISLTIIGGEEDAAYLQECKNIVAAYPADLPVEVNFAGEIPNDQLAAFFFNHHILAIPTRGENFGHAIFEAMKAGRPVLISNQTPWKGLSARKAGWDLPLENKELFITALQQAIDFDQQECDEWCLAAWQYAYDFVNRSNLKTAYYKLFN